MTRGWRARKRATEAGKPPSSGMWSVVLCILRRRERSAEVDTDSKEAKDAKKTIHGLEDTVEAARRRERGGKHDEDTEYEWT